MGFIEGLFTLVGRILLAAIFLASAVNNIQEPQQTQQYMKDKGKLDQLYPENEKTVEYLMWASVACLVVGGISVLFGYKARFGAFLLILFTASSAYFFHQFWIYPKDSPDYALHIAHFMKNAAICGGLFIVLARGAGRFSIDGPPRTYDDF
jgi:putative oxidoreductase